MVQNLNLQPDKAIIHQIYEHYVQIYQRNSITKLAWVADLLTGAILAKGKSKPIIWLTVLLCSDDR